MSWLPHVARFSDGVPMLGDNADSAASVVREIETRIEAAAVDQRTQRVPTRLILVVESPTGIPPARMNALLASAADAGVTVIWLADASGPPPRSTVVVETGPTSTVQRGSGEPPVVLEHLERVDARTATDVARRLAPLVDPGTGSDTTVPDRVGLFEVLGQDCLDPAAIVRRWNREPDDHLYASVGSGKDGLVRLDLSNAGDGPNGLVAGTVGSGKSEFLQSLVLSLAADYGPESLNLLFVDFKGGLTFRDLVGLPQCVGMVRNLDGQLALRARRSLQAELRRRQRILHEHGAVNLTELRERAPEQMLPALVVIIDEYAELAQKLPEFLDGVVEIAQTGRALGIHLLLATQAPGQSVSRIIQNCVKYRISFRLKDSSESMEVLGRGRDASTLPNRPGRGLLLDGDNQAPRIPGGVGRWPHRLRRHVGNRCDDASSTRRPLVVAPETCPPISSEWSRASGTRLRWQADPSLGVRGTSRSPTSSASTPSRCPTTLQSTLASPSGSSTFPMINSRPDTTGRSARLRTFSSSVTDGPERRRPCGRSPRRSRSTFDATQVELIGIDAAGGGLASIDVLPNVRAVVTSSDITRLRRIIALLQREERERQTRVGRAGSLQAHRRSTGEQVPDIIVMIDGLVQLLSALEVIDSNTLSASLQQLITDGAAMGIHFVMTTDQPQRVPMSVRNTARERLILRMSSRDAASAADVQRDLSQLADGRAISSLNNAEVQIAVLAEGDLLDGPAQAQRLEQLAGQLVERMPARPVAEPAEILAPQDLPPHDAHRGAVVLGVEDLFLEPVIVDFAQNPSLVIAGPDLSGRTSTIAWIREALDRSTADFTSIYISGRGEPPPGESAWDQVFANTDDALDTLESLAEKAADHSPTSRLVLLAIDDGDELLENPIGASPEETKQHRRLTAALDSIVKGGRGSGVIVILAGRMNALIRASGWAQRLRQNQQALILAPATLAVTVTDPTFNVTLPRRSEFRPSPGRAVLLRRGTNPELIQIVHSQ